MYKILVLFLLNIIVINANSQENFQITAFGGIMNYSGELNSTFRIPNSKASLGIGAHYNLTNKWATQLNLTYGKINAHDSNNIANTAHRNLQFSNTIFEINTMAVYHFRDLYKKVWSPYINAGVAYFHHEPYTNYNGLKIKLRPLFTEGQNLTSSTAKPYSPHQFAIPFGGGIKVNLTDNIQLAYEVNMRKLFTDYIDDVSARYADVNDLMAKNGQIAVDISYRGDELPGGEPNYPAIGTLRGSPDVKDWYFNHGLKIFISLNSRNSVKYMRCFKF